MSIEVGPSPIKGMGITCFINEQESQTSNLIIFSCRVGQHFMKSQKDLNFRHENRLRQEVPHIPTFSTASHTLLLRKQIT